MNDKEAGGYISAIQHWTKIYNVIFLGHQIDHNL